ncbi:hypothetical protein BH20ACT23_BH20ACT23_03840 [soil metagenome]
MTTTRRRVIFVALVTGALLLEVAILVWFFSVPDSVDEPTNNDEKIESSLDGVPSCGVTPLDASAPNARFDEAKRFAIEVPPAWTSKTDRSLVTLNKKNGRATLSVGRARSGDLSAALGDLRTSLRRSYRKLNVTSIEQLVLDGCPARSIAGRARNSRGAGLNFEGVVVSGPTDNFVIAGFLERGSEPGLDNRVGRVVRSVRFYLSADGDRSG